MHVELYCPRCSRPFDPLAEVLVEAGPEGAPGEGPWWALGDGETLEDSVFAAVTAHGSIHCPSCDAPVALDEAALGRVALDVLSRW